MARQFISSGSGFEREIGYSRAAVDGNWIFVSGTPGFDHATVTVPENLAAQTGQRLRDIPAVLEQAGSSLKDVVRITHVSPGASEFPQCWPILRRHRDEVRPAMMLSAGLSDRPLGQGRGVPCHVLTRHGRRPYGRAGVALATRLTSRVFGRVPIELPNGPGRAPVHAVILRAWRKPPDPANPTPPCCRISAARRPCSRWSWSPSWWW
jgi:enamine deaminase RidA (YjgF/YER057c/UK114 family)